MGSTALHTEKDDAQVLVVANLGPAVRCELWLQAARAISIAVLAVGCVIPLSTTQFDTIISLDGGGTALLDVAVPAGPWTKATGFLTSIPTQCGTLTLVSPKPDEDLVIVGLANAGLWASRSQGPWQQLGTGLDASAPIMNGGPFSIVYDPTNWMRFWVSGSDGPCVYETNDDGNTFVQLGSVNHCDLVSVDFSDVNRQTILAGAHETPQTLYRSTDGGMTWENIGSRLPDGVSCDAPLILDAQTYLIGCGTDGIYGSTDGGATWTQRTTSGGASVPLFAPDQVIYWESANGGLTESTDRGQTWIDVAPAGTLSTVTIGGAGSTTTSGQPIEISNGRLAAIGSNYVLVSSDQGATWAPATNALPITSNENMHGVAYSPQRAAFYVWNDPNTCGTSVVDDALMEYGVQDPGD